MLSKAPPKRKGRGRAIEPSAILNAPLMLVSATYDSDYSSVTLTFNAEINTDGMALEEFGVLDGVFAEEQFVGSTNTGLTANSVTIEMTPVEVVSGGGVRLTVGAGNGIRAASDGSPWEGVSDLALPFP